MKRGVEFITLLAEFFDSYLPDTKGVSENTIRSYKAALRLFFTFLEEEKGIHPEKVHQVIMAFANFAVMKYYSLARAAESAVALFQIPK